MFKKALHIFSAVTVIFGMTACAQDVQVPDEDVDRVSSAVGICYDGWWGAGSLLCGAEGDDACQWWIVCGNGRVTGFCDENIAQTCGLDAQ